MTALSLAMCGCTTHKSSNPLLSEFDTPHGIAPFSAITIDNYREGMIRGMEEQKAEIEAIVNNKEKVEHNAASVKAGNDLQLSS